MRKLLLILLVGWLLLAGFEWLSEPGGWSSPQGDATELSDSALVVEGVAVRDLDGQVAWRGDVDLGPVLARIERGERDPHRNDGGVFQNRERLLPNRPGGHYREYVIRTPGIGHAGPQRLVVGRDGELFYTSDHYRSFRRVR
ncbi:ribonuclease domain-containing protein [Wenzhouxiangella limi]|uniref:Ribonuclease n=1 Tax=Wenzhouxiangella limi TaxID=2707351 RepID=A0A845UX42_9GAMM|nr:ribonuclease domain-containing protein [Wenzhouxiangella limi]NDY94410.1 ribonuclease [Wenzhouxiangella limi]